MSVGEAEGGRCFFAAEEGRRADIFELVKGGPSASKTGKSEHNCYQGGVKCVLCCYESTR